MAHTAEAAPLVAEPAEDADESVTKRLRAQLDTDFLTKIGWIEDKQCWRPPSEDPLVGYRVCTIMGCGTVIAHRRTWCYACIKTWKASGLAKEEFQAVHRREVKEWDETICAVHHCERPAKNARTKVCTAHLWPYQQSGQSLAEFTARTDLTAYPHPGLCRVALCDWRRYTTQTAEGLCLPHTKRLQAQRRKNPDTQIDLENWLRSVPARRDARRVDLRGLSPRAVAEILIGLQERYRAGNITEMFRLRLLCTHARTQQASTLEDLVIPIRGIDTLRSTIVKAARLAASDPETERHKDTWNAAVFGQGNQTIDFSKITQPWLREVVKYWVSEEMPRRRGKSVGSVMQGYVASMTRLSESLRLHRTDDRGDIPARLGREDAICFLNRLAYLTSIGKITLYMRINDCRNVKRVINDLRNRGKRMPGDITRTLPPEFTFLAEDIPRPADDDEPGRALPDRVLSQLCQALPELEARSGPSFRVATELLIDTGRRPEEICRLPWDCLATSADGKSILIYHDYKNNRPGRRLPIADATADVVRTQQRLVQDRFPDTPLGELALLPAPKRSPTGTRCLTEASLTSLHRVWVDSLPPLLADGDIEFNKAAIYAYAYRHSYAQRHADAGVPPDVLRDLMGHRSMRTTQIYYRITGKRMRQAVERVAAHQFDRNGQRTWQRIQGALDGEHVRLRIGQVSVPFGICMEPSNVKAGGHACPFRFRCLGCGHFRTDASYLPELKDYLNTLLRDRERVLAAGELDPWARTEAAPSDTEISKLRQLIHRVEDSMDDLTDEDREQIREAATTLRRTRQVVDLGMPVIGSFIDQTRNEHRP
ncbi:tyrosine-type recombinase/integrase [Streptomyces sp. NBC_01217]|uniref:tyrosine-type recombinase/integrase n=1 Tax=Streptomyces sp. NBC_01217 TaxID=2903779 RepID=UPI002E162B38|nr:site-specific integrase [Streptomyces sp. NBC_01217]